MAAGRTDRDRPLPDIIFERSHTAARSFLYGTQPLWKAFWLLYIGGHLLWGLLSGSALTGVLVYQPQWWEASLQNWPLALATIVGVALLLLAFFAWCALAVWRCSAQSPNALWRWAARAVVGLHALWWLLSMAIVVPSLRRLWELPNGSGAF